jgi:hypothetical protein
MKTNIDPRVLEANRLARKLRKQGSPSQGSEAARLWELCSYNHGIAYPVAKYLYLKAGYIPFCGYPLERKEG